MRRNNKQLYESIIRDISQIIKRNINEAEDLTTRSKRRLNDLLNGPNADDWRYYKNQLNKCVEGKRKERVQTWYDILKTQKPEFAKRLEDEFENYLSDNQRKQIQEEKRKKEEEEQKRREEERKQAQQKAEYDKQMSNAFDLICKFLDYNDKLKSIAYRSSRWNSYGGRIGSYSHQWYTASDKKISDIYSVIRRQSKNIIIRTSWSGGYDHDWGMRYEGGESWDTYNDYSYNLNGSYDDESSITLYTVKNCPKPLLKKCLDEIRDKVPLLTDEDITELYQDIVS